MLFVTGIATARVTINALIGAHHLSHVSFLHQSLESGQIGFPEVALGQVLNVEGVTVPLRTAMHSKVLGTGQQLTIFAHAQVFALIANTL